MGENLFSFIFKKMFRFKSLTVSVLLVVIVHESSQAKCGCRTVSTCYEDISNRLRQKDETMCVEEAADGSATYVVYLNLLKEYCGKNYTLSVHSKTFEERNLYEVVIGDDPANSNKPTILIDAGQDAAVQPVNFALYIIQQLLGCAENKHLVEKFKWVILPSVNPDGLEFSRHVRPMWRKNTHMSNDNHTYGVDVSRNFADAWDSCAKVKSGFSGIYPGTEAFSENESVFVKSMLEKHKKNLEVYLSLRGNGHGIFYPFAYGGTECPRHEDMKVVAANATLKVNQKAGTVQMFLNQSIFEQNGKPHCGHSSDFAARTVAVPLVYEMRVFLGTKGAMLKQFSKLPKGFDKSLRAGYWNGIKEICDSILHFKTNDISK